MRTTLERGVVWMEQQARRIESDVEIDPNSIHGEGGDARHRSETVRQATVRHEQVGNRSTGLEALARVHPNRRVLTAALGLHENPDKLLCRNPTVRSAERLLSHAGRAAQFASIQSELSKRSEEIRGLEATHGRSSRR
jgi:hypothetical protein